MALLSSLGLLVAGIGFAVGYMTIAVAGMVLSGLAYLILVMEDIPAGPGPGKLPDWTLSRIRLSRRRRATGIADCVRAVLAGDLGLCQRR